MSKIFTPTNQIRLTNVAVVRIKKAGKRFEIACYRNKVVSWRNKVEKNIDEVLQIHTVFTNVSKGQVAKREDIVKAFGTADQTEICKQILEHGELQVSDKERQSQLDQLFREIATTICNKTVNPELNRPYPVTMIEKAMKRVHYSIKTTQNAKVQALVIIKLIQKADLMPIERAKLRMKVNFRGKEAKKLKDKILALESKEIEKIDEELDDDITISFSIDPGEYKAVESLANSQKKGTVLYEVLGTKDIVLGDESL